MDMTLEARRATAIAERLRVSFVRIDSFVSLILSLSLLNIQTDNNQFTNILKILLSVHTENCPVIPQAFLAWISVEISGVHIDREGRDIADPTAFINFQISREHFRMPW